ncbi:gpW family head-tail joining protein [Klebsiella pneumoniae]|uniref:gpW family head-tail joining protein n=1 Tax=Klebsiella pneumoniae TaxID=573 RepID=UPI001D192407|nr:gpW family head-tail joining protein [Klebsiella pneumoniae]
MSSFRDALQKAQQAYIDLTTGSRGVSFSYSQETDTVGILSAKLPADFLLALIQLLQAQLGIVARPRKPVRFRF